MIFERLLDLFLCIVSFVYLGPKVLYQTMQQVFKAYLEEKPHLKHFGSYRSPSLWITFWCLHLSFCRIMIALFYFETHPSILLDEYQKWCFKPFPTQLLHVIFKLVCQCLYNLLWSEARRVIATWDFQPLNSVPWQVLEVNFQCLKCVFHTQISQMPFITFDCLARKYCLLFSKSSPFLIDQPWFQPYFWFPKTCSDQLFDQCF